MSQKRKSLNKGEKCRHKKNSCEKESGATIGEYNNNNVYFS